MYTSLKLSKLLQENGCELENENYVTYFNPKFELPDITAYDILNDLCVKYAKEMFGEVEIVKEYEEGEDNPFLGGILKYPYYEGACITYTVSAYLFHAQQVLDLLQQGKQEEAEEYLWEHCLFNPKK